jgi:Ni/Fe-hydrogenase b-type cytochrome subunit
VTSHTSATTLGPVPAHKTKPENYKWIYLWHWPIRAMHWVAALCILVMVVTGFYIGKPYFMTSGEASSHFLMGWMRFIHFAAAGVLVATAIVRIYWLFVGNKFERWRALFPIFPRDWINLFRMIKFYLMIQPEKGPHYLGHNTPQQLSYTAIYLTAGIQVVTGFAMYGLADPNGFFYSVFGWVNPLLGGVRMVRLLHHLLTWVFIIFVVIHIYLALRADILERSGTISSIISGGRFVRTDEQYEDE